jgi:hypothetical protein
VLHQPAEDAPVQRGDDVVAVQRQARAEHAARARAVRPSAAAA